MNRYSWVDHYNHDAFCNNDDNRIVIDSTIVVSSNSNIDVSDVLFWLQVIFMELFNWTSDVSIQSGIQNKKCR